MKLFFIVGVFMVFDDFICLRKYPSTYIPRFSGIQKKNNLLDFYKIKPLLNDHMEKGFV